MRKLHYDKKQIAIALLIVIFFFMILGLNARLSELFRLASQRDAMQTKVAAIKYTELALQTQIAFANSDLAVEAWARDQGHMALPGDKVIIPLPPYQSTMKFTTSPTPTPILIENWQVWWDFLFAK